MDERLGLKDGDFATILQHISKFSAINKAVIFGSRAKGTYKPGSDVDLAVWVSDNLSILELSGELNDETLLPYNFDIVDYATIDNTDLCDHINRVGLVIFP